MKRHRDRQTGRASMIHRKTDRQNNTHTHRQTVKQRPTDTQMMKQTGRQAERDRHRDRENSVTKVRTRTTVQETGRNFFLDLLC